MSSIFLGGLIELYAEHGVIAIENNGSLLSTKFAPKDRDELSKIPDFNQDKGACKEFKKRLRKDGEII